MAYFKITNKQQPSSNLINPFADSKQSSKRTIANQSREAFMKQIAQEVRMYNKNSDDFQQVCFSYLYKTINENFFIISFRFFFYNRQLNNFQSNKSNNV